MPSEIEPGHTPVRSKSRCQQDARARRRTGGSFGLLDRCSVLLENTELVSLRVRQHDPRHLVTLPNIDTRRSESDESLYLGGLMIRTKIDMKTVLSLLGFVDGQEQDSWNPTWPLLNLEDLRVVVDDFPFERFAPPSTQHGRVRRCDDNLLPLETHVSTLAAAQVGEARTGGRVNRTRQRSPITTLPNDDAPRSTPGVLRPIRSPEMPGPSPLELSRRCWLQPNPLRKRRRGSRTRVLHPPPTPGGRNRGIGPTPAMFAEGELGFAGQHLARPTPPTYRDDRTGPVEAGRERPFKPAPGRRTRPLWP